ncbi:MAG: NAD(P)H-hydrate dehydratase [Crocinitomicaceae bacterium]|nr:NAD(P)H-hydrate dehydratase [Crocinitomicaceae bacterium]
MKILTASQIRAVDAHTIQHEPITSVDLMERASSACVNKITSLFPTPQHFSIFCGTGNNGGDGLAIARLLNDHGFTVDVFLVHFSKHQSEDNKVNLGRIKDSPNINLIHLYEGDKLPVLNQKSLVVDALIGTGVTRPLTGLLKEVVDHLNKHSTKTVSIDVPSGLRCDGGLTPLNSTIVQASITLSFKPAKLSFLLPDSASFVGTLYLLDIGLDQHFIDSQESPYSLFEKEGAKEQLHKRAPFSHKGTFGHSLIIAGSYGKIGAAVLSAKACLRSGSGLVSAYIPSCGYGIIQSSLPEVMVHTSETPLHLSGNLDFTPYNSIGIGPGIGQDNDTLALLKHLIQTVQNPLVIDADALNLIAENKDLLSSIPDNSILTPHVKEFDRVFGICAGSFDRLQVQQGASIKYNIYIVLKGKYSSISCPDGSVYFNTTGNPGMATAGSGDALTGVITGFLGQGYTAKQSALLGAYLHGLAGDLAKETVGEEGMIASDIIQHLGVAQKDIREN